METVTKKEFMKLHKAGQLRLVASALRTTKEQLHKRLLSSIGDLPEKLTTNVDVANYGEYIVRNVFICTYNNRTFYFLEERADNSKCSTCSMENTEYNTILYVAV